MKELLEKFIERLITLWVWAENVPCFKLYFTKSRYTYEDVETFIEMVSEVYYAEKGSSSIRTPYPQRKCFKKPSLWLKQVFTDSELFLEHGAKKIIAKGRTLNKVAFSLPLSKMPVLINEKDFYQNLVAKWRLSVGK